MALKFLNKKGWHTGSLRNIENVWKAEQKHDAEQKKLEELKKQIKEEREAQEFRILQEQAGLAPKQERLEFLYDSGLAVGKTSTDEYLLGKPLEESKETELAQAADGPGALFVSKPQSANDAWRKLHSDPLLMIRQQEQAALAAIKSNPVKMDMIRKEVLGKNKENDIRDKKRKHKHKRKELKKKKGKLRHGSDSNLSGSDKEDDIVHSKHRSREVKRRMKDSDGDSSSGGEEDIAHAEHKSKETNRNLKDKDSESSSSEEDTKHSKKHRGTKPNSKETNPVSEKSNAGISEQKHDDRWRSGSGRRHGASPGPSDEDRRRQVASGRGGGNVEQRHGDGGPRGRSDTRDERSPERHSDDTRWRNGSSRRSYRSPDRNHYDARMQGGSQKRNGRSPDRNGHDRRWHHGPGRRNDSSPDQKRYADRHGTSEKRNGRSPDWNRDDRRQHDVVRRNDKSPERDRYEGRNQGGSSEAKHVVASTREKNSEGLQEEQGGAQSAQRLTEASVPRQPKTKLSDAEKAARLKEMQVDAELHEEQRWQRIKKGAEADAKDAEQAKHSNYGRGKSFMDDTNKSAFGAQNTSNASLSESVRRRAHYRDRGAADGQSNAFRR